MQLRHETSCADTHDAVGASCVCVPVTLSGARGFAIAPCPLVRKRGARSSWHGRSCGGGSNSADRLARACRFHYLPVPGPHIGSIAVRLVPVNRSRRRIRRSQRMGLRQPGNGPCRSSRVCRYRPADLRSTGVPFLHSADPPQYPRPAQCAGRHRRHTAEAYGDPVTVSEARTGRMAAALVTSSRSPASRIPHGRRYHGSFGRRGDRGPAWKAAVRRPVRSRTCMGHRRCRGAPAHPSARRSKDKLRASVRRAIDSRRPGGGCRGCAGAQ